MNPSSLNTIIQAERTRSLPTCPGDLESKVLRRIHLSQQDRQIGFVGLLQRAPALFTLMAVVAFLLSTTTALGVSTAQMKRAERHEFAIRALDFDLIKDPSLLAASRNANWRMK